MLMGDQSSMLPAATVPIPILPLSKAIDSVALPLLPVILLWQDQQVMQPLALGMTKFSC